MNSTILAVAAALAVAVCARGSDAVHCSSVVGYARVTVPGDGGVRLIGVNFGRSSGAGPLRTSDVFGAGQLEKGDEPALADTVYIWDPGKGDGGGYDTVFQRQDGAFYAADTMAAFDPEIPAGTAVFVRTREGTTDRQILLMGEVVHEALQNVSVPAGLSAFASPYAAALDLNQVAGAEWSGATAGVLPSLADNVWIWNPDKQVGGGYDVFFLHSNTRKWHRIDAPGVVADAAVLAIGRGAFYSARQPYVNELTRPYPR